MEKYPVGTIVKLKDCEKMFMIVGYCLKSKLKKLMKFDYFVCNYPEGVVGLKKTILIKNDDIEKIVYMGYKGE